RQRLRSSGCKRRYWALPKLHASRQPHILCATLLTPLCGRNSETPPVGVCTPQRCSGDLPPSPPAEKATARQDQTGQASDSGGRAFAPLAWDRLAIILSVNAWSVVAASVHSRASLRYSPRRRRSTVNSAARTQFSAWYS